MNIKDKIAKLTKLTRQREDLCCIQSKAVDKSYRLMFTMDTNYGYVSHSFLLPELEQKLKETVRDFYEEEIKKITEEIQKLCQEQ